MKKGLFTFLLTCILGVMALSAQVENPATWTFTQKDLGNGEYELTMQAILEPGWKVYSMFTPEGGPLATTLTLNEEGKGVEFIGKAVENEPQKHFDELFDVDVWYFESEYIIKQKIKVTDPVLAAVKGTLEYQVCQQGQCIMFDTDFEIPLSGHQQDVSRETVTEQIQPATGDHKGDESLWTFFWLAFIAGLAAVVMPCVFPMIPMTVSFFMHGDANKAKAKAKALFFSLSIIVIYTILGVVVSILLGPDFINWLSTNWVPNLFFFIIFMIFAASFFGAFEIVLPSWLVNKSDKQADKGGYVGAFFMAFTLVLVSFSCTAPIVGTVLVEAARGSVLRPIIGMLGFSLAVALPFGFFAFFPSKLSNLPKSGGWLNSVKVVLGFIEIALGLKFLMVADQTYHWGLLDREVYIAIWVAVFTLQGFYLMGKLKFKNDSDLSYIGVPRLAFIIATFAFVVYLIPGMFGAPLKALAGYLPPQETIDFDVNRIVRDNAKEIMKSGIAVGGTNSRTMSEACEDPKYADFLHLPHGIDGYFDFQQALKCARAQDKPLFIDFTGHGCVNCREMEQSVWSDPRILDMLKHDYVVVALYIDDKKSLPENEWYVSDYDGKQKKTLGKKNADFQIKYFHSNAQPNYILLDSRAEGQDLEKYMLMPARGYDLNRDAFYEYLKEGLKKFKERN
ncbi:cytochrome c biogenesis protein CcdA [uncultured Odoribacter sp.]|uniref:protein-disulfide reductase DsbD family protein n=1 Tax=uncultured Odoribacter sp. TaxID=876416 RepID=UPI00262FB3E9|nr:cytochrome c biogenesis protein CcdA [uncultured Odoribacter sp.]